jgi:hypothetical protein
MNKTERNVMGGLAAVAITLLILIFVYVVLLHKKLPFYPGPGPVVPPSDKEKFGIHEPSGTGTGW